MTPERWSRVRDLFAAVADLEPLAAAARLDAECAGDPELRAEVDRLLAADLQAGSFLEDPAWDTAAEEAAAGEVGGPAPGRLGPYRLEREIGRGGMGIVWLAERADGLYRKRVALKRIRSGLDGAGVVQRFHREREILARLDHPGIAGLYDAGSDEEGRPYFVMEYVEGVPITRYCEERRLSIPARLELFREVCSAVHYAHQHLVAHRDLKPGNILVTADGWPRLLDFGIAKLLDDGGTAEETRTAERAMTPDYASPEQVRGAPATTASDIYSLGVLLYELLTGRRPYRLAGLSSREAERIVCEEDPRPPGRIAAPLARDLDRIVLQAMHKDSGRRYASANQLADDVHRYLQGLPVAAAGDGFWYRTGKLLCRHKAAAAFLMLLTLFGLGMAVLAVERTRALWRAEVEARKAREVTDFLVRLFRYADPRRQGGETLTAGEILRRGIASVETELAGELEPQSTLLGAIGRVYLNLGLPRDAVPVLERSLAVRRQVHGENHPAVAEALDDLARALRERGDYAAAEPLAREGLARRRRLLGERHPDVARSLNNLGLLLHRAGDDPGAEAALREALEIRRELKRDPEGFLPESLNNLSAVLQTRGDHAGAEPLCREAVAFYRARFGPRHASVATSLNTLALVLHRKGDPAAAEPLLREALAIHRQALGEDHPSVAGTLENLAGLLGERNDFAAAEPLARQALALHRKRQGDRHPFVAGGLNTLAVLLHAKGDLAEAERLFREALALRRELLPAEHPDIANSLDKLGSVLVDLSRPLEAEPLLRQAVADLRKTLPAGHAWTAAAESHLGACLAALGRTAEAEALLRGSYPALERALGRNHSYTRRARKALESLRPAGSTATF